MSHKVIVQRIEKVGPYVFPLTMKTHNLETLKEFDDLVVSLCEQYKDRKDVRIASPSHNIHKDWDSLVVLDGYVHPGQYTAYSCEGHEFCWHVYDLSRKNEFGEKFCVRAHTSYPEACELIGQECPGEDE